MSYHLTVGGSPYPSSHLVGRRQEQQALMSALQALDQGQGAFILVSGEPGIGKSTLARWLAAQARERGVPTVWGHCWEAGRAPPYWPWTQCLRQVLDVRPLPDEARRHANRLLPDQGPAVSAEENLHPDHVRFRLLESARSVLSATAANGPLVVILEDLHAADHDSLVLLQFLCPALAQMPVLLVGTFRDAEARRSDQTSPLWQCTRNATLLRPRPFDTEDIRDFLSSQPGATAADELADRIRDLTEGNPLFVSELAVMARGHRDGPLHAKLPATLRQVIRQHLETLPDDCLSHLESAAVLGREFEPRALAELCGVSEEAAWEALRPALDGDLLSAVRPGVLRFRHILYREELYAGLSAERRADLHRNRAKALRASLDSGHGGHWTELAEHLESAGPRHRLEAARAWRQAARHARDRMALTEACALYGCAVDSLGAGPGVEPEERAEILLAWARTELEAGRVEAGRDLCIEVHDLAQTLNRPELLAGAALTYGRAYVIANVDPVLVRLLRQALDRLRSGDDSVRARLQSRLAAALQPADEPSVPIRMAREAVELARGTGNARTLYETLASAVSALMDFAPVTERHPLNEEFASLALAHDEVTAAFRAHALLMIDAVEAGDPAGLERAILALERLGRQIELPHYDWKVESARALQAFIAGSHDSALERHERAQAHAERAGDLLGRMTLAIQGFCIRSQAGRLDRAGFDRTREAIESACADVGSDDLFVRPLLARHLFHAGDPESARAICGTGAVERLVGMKELSNLTVLGDCAALSGDRELAARLVDLLEPHRDLCSHAGLYGMTWNGPVACTLARMRVLLGDQEQAAEDYRHAETIARRFGAMGSLETIRAERQAAGTAPVADVNAEPARDRLILEDQGEVYRLDFRGRELMLQPTRGMVWLSQLVAEPGREWHVLDLASPPDAPRDTSDSGPMLDETARDAYRKRLTELEAALEEAAARRDDELRQRLDEERDMLRRELARAFGLGGRSRTAGKAAERARVNVTRRIRDAIKRIAEQHPEAGRYLENAVKTGRYCSYNPA